MERWVNRFPINVSNYLPESTGNTFQNILYSFCSALCKPRDLHTHTHTTHTHTHTTHTYTHTHIHTPHTHTHIHTHIHTSHTHTHTQSSPNLLYIFQQNNRNLYNSIIIYSPPFTAMNAKAHIIQCRKRQHGCIWRLQQNYRLVCEQ